jgi:hypothetical protein
MRTSPSNYLQRPILLLDRCGPVLHPITVVHVQDGPEQAMLRAMYMSADHAVGLMLARGCKHCSIAEVGKELEGLASGVAEIVGKGTTFIGVRLRLPMVPVMNSLGARVPVISDYRQQTVWIERAVKLMPMDHKHPTVVGSSVN